MDPGTGLIVGQAIAFALFVISEMLGSSNSNYNSIFDLVMGIISGIFVKPAVTKVVEPRVVSVNI